ncbi:MAG: 16S rRNA processing protein RimM [Flavobacteriales bacterium]|nr:16S rRNA processing protein RimM [Flavobacteriales bacterium]
MEFTEIGVIVKPHGLKGAVVVKAEAAYVSQFKGFEQVYLSQFNSKVPYAVVDLAVLGTSMFKITLRGVETVQQADALRGVELFQENKLLTFSDEVDLVGMEVFSKDGARIGEVVDTIENKAQLLLVIAASDDEEHYVPLVEEFLVSLDVKAKSITLDLPEGLLEL